MIKWFYTLAKTLMGIFYFIWYKIEFVGIDNIPQREGYIVACNHVHNFDPVFLSLKIKRPIHFLGKAELFDNRYYGWLFRIVGGIRVDRGAGDNSLLEKCRAISELGESIGVFPEGTRSVDGEIGRPKSGMAVIAKLTGYDILPCAVSIGRPFKFKSKIIINYGELIEAEKLGLDDESPRALKRATRLVWEEITKLYGAGQQDEQ